MLEKKVPFCIDHFSIATTHRDRPIDLVTKLGFTTADNQYSIYFFVHHHAEISRLVDR